MKKLLLLLALLPVSFSVGRWYGQKEENIRLDKYFSDCYSLIDVYTDKISEYDSLAILRDTVLNFSADGNVYYYCKAGVIKPKVMVMGHHKTSPCSTVLYHAIKVYKDEEN